MTNKIDLYTAPLYTKEYTHAEFHFNVNVGTHAVVSINVVVVNGDKARAMAPGTNPYVVIEEPLPNPEFITMGWAKELADKVARQLIEANRQRA